MKKFYSNFITLILFSAFASNVQAQLTVDSTFSPTAMVQSLLGAGVTVTNITYTGDTVHASGTFSDPSGAFGILQGIMLTSGSVGTAPGPNNSDSEGPDNLQPGDALLDLYTIGFTQDATILEFDFTSQSDSIEFNYVFGSEEYNEFVGQGYNDVFGFFLSGPGITGIQNVALVPGTNTPVIIDSINNGYTPTGQVSTGPCTNCQYYVDNYLGTAIQYDGYTTVLTARAGVIPCETYHIKLAIADVTDGVYDSGVFIEGGSFKSTGTFQVVFEGGDAPGILQLCPGECATLTAPYMYNYNWNTGDTTQSITTCTAGLYFVSTSNGTCFASSSTVNINFVTPPAAATITNTNHVLQSSVTDPGYTYQWYMDSTAVAGGTANSLVLTVPGCYHLVITDQHGCTSVSDTVCDFGVGLAEYAMQHGIVITPNPAGESFSLEISGNSGGVSLSIVDLTGKEIYSQPVEEQDRLVQIRSAAFAKGIYFILLKTHSGIVTQRLAIE